MCNRNTQGHAGAHQHARANCDRDLAADFQSNRDGDGYFNSDWRRNFDSDADRYPVGYRDCDSHPDSYPNAYPDADSDSHPRC